MLCFTKMTTTLETKAFTAAEPGERRFLLSSIDWRTYSVLRELLDSPGLRMTYIAGALELMSPSIKHEDVKTRIARLLEAYALERDLPLYGYGSTTFRKEAREVGLEPDECYTLGGELKEVPDFAIEVVVTSGGIDKLPAYARLGVPEVWFWVEDGLRLFRLGGNGYERVSASSFIPGLDLDLLATLVRRSDQPQAVRELRDRLRAGQ